jgi:hypothetical protein
MYIYITDKYYNESEHILCWTIFFPEHRAFYEKLWNNMVQVDRPQITV